jgi:hypothetical protein
MEMYLKEIGTTPYPDVLDGFSQTLRLFAKNSILDTKYLKTEVVCIDEPSFGFLNINAANDLIQQTLEKPSISRGQLGKFTALSVRLPDLLQIKQP